LILPDDFFPLKKEADEHEIDSDSEFQPSVFSSSPFFNSSKKKGLCSILYKYLYLWRTGATDFSYAKEKFLSKLKYFIFSKSTRRHSIEELNDMVSHEHLKELAYQKAHEILLGAESVNKKDFNNGDLILNINSIETIDETKKATANKRDMANSFSYYCNIRGTGKLIMNYDIVDSLTIAVAQDRLLTTEQLQDCKNYRIFIKIPTRTTDGRPNLFHDIYCKKQLCFSFDVNNPLDSFKCNSIVEVDSYKIFILPENLEGEENFFKIQNLKRDALTMHLECQRRPKLNDYVSKNIHEAFQEIQEAEQELKRQYNLNSRRNANAKKEEEDVEDIKLKRLKIS
jgi:hypothetical protein